MKHRKRIHELVNFFYSSTSSKKVPLRIAISTGRFSGSDLTELELTNFLDILFNADMDNLKEELAAFRERWC